MEYIEAKPLSFVPISSEQEIREIMQQLFEILHYLHQRAIAHRDIKL
jgi:serine/threonine protein kinase